jgi:lysophospholipase L1-like esterase
MKSVSKFYRVCGRLLAGLGIAGVLLCGTAEVAVRLSGMTDFPLYEADSEIGYILAPNQKGAFLNKNHWVFNEKCQGAGPWKPNGKTDLLLLGDSLVLGGNPLDQPDKLGPQLQDRLPGWQVWPASAGSWSVKNEVVYLQRFPEVAGEVSSIVWVVNTGDLDRLSVWRTNVTHPRSHPWSSLWYVFNKYVLLPKLGMSPPEPGAIPEQPVILPETVSALQQELADLKRQKPDRPILFVLYPTKDEERGIGMPFYEKFRQALDDVALPTARVFEVRNDPRWNTGLYRDGIHPNAKGDGVLAAIIAEQLSH